jgi:hypothetical protein
MYRSRFFDGRTLLTAQTMCSETESEILFLIKTRARPFKRIPPFSDTFEQLLLPDLLSTACDLEDLVSMLDFHARAPSHFGNLQREYCEDTFAGVQHALVSFAPAGYVSTSKSTLIDQAQYHRQKA